MTYTPDRMGVGVASGIAIEQERALEEAKHNVSAQAMEMKRCLDKNKLMEGLKHASIMLSELKTSSLTPKNYYELYTGIADEMRHLEQYLLEEYRKGRKVEDLYELVQYAGNILPRLYLLVTVGVVYIQTEEHSVREILRDIVEMCRGMQHPLRGLFLRNYLIQTTKNILPQGSTPDSAAGDGERTSSADLHDSLDYVLMNFAEMNKLWVRMQYQGHSKERGQRERERSDVKQLVGANLYAISSLENLTVEVYEEKVLPVVLGQVINSRDPISQEYLMEVIVHVFPDEFHIATLPRYLEACTQLVEEVDMNTVITTLITRLTQIAQRAQTGEGPAIPAQMELFKLISDKIETIIKTRKNMPVDKVIGMQSSLLSLALTCYAHEPTYVNVVLTSTTNIFKSFDIEKLTAKSKVASELVELLKLPVEHYKDVLQVADLDGFAPLLNFLDWEPRRDMCSLLVENALAHACLIPDVDKTQKVLTLVETLFRDQKDAPDVSDEEEGGGGGGGFLTEFEADACLLAKFLHNLYSPDPNIQYLMLQAAWEFLSAGSSGGGGGSEREGRGGAVRRQVTLPPLVFLGLQLAQRFHSIRDQDHMWAKKCKKIMDFCRAIVDTLVGEERAELSLRLFLQCALVVDTLPFPQHESIAYEFFSQALGVYEDAISESRAQLCALQLVMGSLERMRCFTEENHEPLRTQCTLSASKLFKKPDQARAVAAAAHLHWNCVLAGQEGQGQPTPIRDGKRVNDCLKRSVKTACQVVDVATRAHILIEILQNYVHYFLQPYPTPITSKTINEIVGKIREEMGSVQNAEEEKRIEKELAMALNHLQAGVKAAGESEELTEKFSGLTFE